MPPKVISGISSCFQLLFQCQGQVAHVLLTRSPLVYPRRGLTVRLACVKHAASVRPEPGSNSPLKSVDVAPMRDVHRLFGVSRQELVPRRGPSLPKEPSLQTPADPGPPQPADGAFRTNSSTFGTLLSSQGSSAHRSPASRPRCGATCVNLPVRQDRVNSDPLPRRTPALLLPTR